MNYSLPHTEIADNNEKEVSRLSNVNLNESSQKTIQDMSRNMKYYNICLAVFGSFWLIIMILAVIEENYNLAETLFNIVVILIQAVIFLLIFKSTRRTASSFKIIVQDGNFSQLMPALEQMKKLYKLQRRIVVLILILIPVKATVDIVSHFFDKG
ncbi:MAG: hypothetical protein RIE73_00540 [Coleofasciculus sp. C1-SOL-03]|uniref:hypothetical protein n=1 Tax=Coleofasciculus sp. C1-SOL-03 TaxID=3069522 RepID=UPI0032F0F461